MFRSSRAVRTFGPRVLTRHFSKVASTPSSKTQVYVSRSRDPYLNLSIEHELLQKTPPDSTILFLYTNRPCVVIGRNQNPWLEINLPLLRSLCERKVENTKFGAGGSIDGGVELVRRRSGGGTVFHDEGNVNYSVICPPASFDRNKHAEMVVRALRSLGVEGARVNCRHDIVLDVSSAVSSSAASPAPTSPSCEAPLPQEPGKDTFKVSGSAYKLTRLRSLHHGTCLLSSPNLDTIGRLLRSPAQPFIKARGVESVRSPVRNTGAANEAFERAVVKEFKDMYGRFDIEKDIGVEDGHVEGVAKGMKELESMDWTYGQTPLFTFSTHPTVEDERQRPDLPGQFHLSFEARHGVIQNFSIGNEAASSQTLSALANTRIHGVNDWAQTLQTSGVDASKASLVGPWLNGMLGTGSDKA